MKLIIEGDDVSKEDLIEIVLFLRKKWKKKKNYSLHFVQKHQKKKI